MRIPISIALILVVTSAVAQVGKVYPDPSPREHFRPNQLAFEGPKDGVARDEFRSLPFYAVILKTAERCSVKDAERVEIQKLFPANKVFYPADGCNEDDVYEDMISYSSVNPKVGFIAVYAGETLQQAQQFLAKVKETGRFPGANVRRMQVVLHYP